MEDLCSLHGLLQHASQPTRGDNTLDLVISNFLVNPVTIDILPPIGSSDHATVMATIAVPPQRDEPTSRHVWRYVQADWCRLKHFFRTAH